MKKTFAIILIVSSMALTAAIAHAQSHTSAAKREVFSDPAAQALKLYLAIQKQDWRTMPMCLPMVCAGESTATRTDRRLWTTF
jgi:hypothetical protein